MRRLSTVLVTAAIALTACGGGAAATSDKSEIVVGSIGPQSGAQSSLHVDNEAMNAYFQNLNDTKGGINGHKVKVVSVDDQFNAANTIGVARQLVEQDNVAFLCDVAGTPNNAALRPYIVSKKIANIAPGSAPLPAATGLPATPAEYWVLPAYQRANAYLTAYAVQQLHKQHVGILYTEDDAGLPAVSGVRWEMQQLGLPAPTAFTFKLTDTTLVPQAEKFKAAGVDFLILWHTPAAMGLLMNSAAQIGYKPTFGGGWFTAGPTLDKLTNGADRGNTYFATYLGLPGEAPVDAMQKVLSKYAPDAPVTEGHTLQGYSAGDICAHVIQQATAGGKSLSRAGVLDAVKKVNFKDEYVPGIDFSKPDQAGVTSMRILTTNSDGSLKALTSFEKLPQAPLTR